MRTEPMRNPLEAARWWRDWTASALLLLLFVGFAMQLSWAWMGLHSGRFFDERHGFRNIRALVVDGRLRPVIAYYPSLSYLPYTPLLAGSEALHRATGIEAFRVFDVEDPRWISKTGYALARLVSVIAGTASLSLTYAVGRRAVSPRVGLLAAALLSVVWGFLLVSIKLKPDVLVILFSLIAFWWSLDALDEPRAARFALAGVGIGLAAAAKYYAGATAAVPLAVGALAAAGRRPATWGRLALAAATAIATFFALNPWPDLVFQNVVFQHREYGWRGVAEGMSHWGMLAREADWLLQEHGAVVLVFVVAGCVGLAVRAAGRQGAGPGRLGASMLLSMILGHLLFFAAATTYFTFQNFVPVTPFTSIAAAWAMISASEGVTRALPVRARPASRLLIWIPAAALLLGIQLSRAYEAAVPPTSALVARHLRSWDVRQARIVYQESLVGGEGLLQGRQGPRIVRVERVDALPRDLLEGVDALVFPAQRLEGPERASYSRLVDSWGGSVRRVEPRWFGSSGPSLVLALNEWRRAGEPVRRTLEVRDGRLRMPLPEPLRRGEIVSVALLVRASSKASFPDSVRVRAVGETDLYKLPSGSHRSWIVTRKLEVRRRTDELRLELPELANRVEPLTVELHRWRREPRQPGG